jgi:hypothetical protein
VHLRPSWPIQLSSGPGVAIRRLSWKTVCMCWAARTMAAFTTLRCPYWTHAPGDGTPRRPPPARRRPASAVIPPQRSVDAYSWSAVGAQTARPHAESTFSTPVPAGACVVCVVCVVCRVLADTTSHCCRGHVVDCRSRFSGAGGTQGECVRGRYLPRGRNFVSRQSKSTSALRSSHRYLIAKIVFALLFFSSFFLFLLLFIVSC